MIHISSFCWKPSWYQDKSTSINKIKTGSLKPLCDERLTKRGVGGRKVTINVRRKIIKKDSQQKMREI